MRDDFRLYQLLADNPLFYVFDGTYELGFTMAVVLLAGSLYALSRRNLHVGIGLVAMTVATTIGSVDLAVKSNLVVSPFVMTLASLVWFGGACVAAWRHIRPVSLKLLQILSSLVMAALSVTLSISLMANFYPVASADWNFWAGVEDSMWAADFLLLAPLALSGLFYWCVWCSHQRRPAVLPSVSGPARPGRWR